MPLILIVGVPGSGKSTRAQSIKDYFNTEHQTEVVIISEESLALNKNVAYSSNMKEKKCRAFLRSNVEKHLSKDTVVILDSLNYIKGYRYELYCLARKIKTTYCVVYCNTPILQAEKWNAINKNGFDHTLFVDYCKRMEEPKSKNRWDSPLFNLNFEQDTPVKDIAQVILFEKKKSKDPISTKMGFIKTGNYLYDFDKNLQSIIDQIIKQQNDYREMNGGMDRILMTIKFTEFKRQLVLKRSVPVGDLKQFKSEFLKMNQMNPFGNITEAAESFIDYIQSYEEDF